MTQCLLQGEWRDRPDRFTQRAAQAGMTLEIKASESSQALRVRANVSAVEQILFNLVDNACKYAGSAADRRIHLETDGRGNLTRLRISDHGPGISRAQARRLFRPFSKSARQAASLSEEVLGLTKRLLSWCLSTKDLLTNLLQKIGLLWEELLLSLYRCIYGGTKRLWGGGNTGSLCVTAHPSLSADSKDQVQGRPGTCRATKEHYV